ncbi:hypothetical protein JRO89_XS06G0127900 [Xanthoceras sorbifolium]|uniref:Myb/SANT-like domain-containing protein n=1 Tax=Xanthoceras sorbifolium TaxID=99658 RepID=A0ABQ8HYD8_9ROSI|nr:hypothetical protein JRO89_XS06G0127900 [Xanthoceras sorbifolium]
MDVGGSSQPNKHEKRASRLVWTKEEEEALLGIMDEIVANGGRADCGSFKTGTFKIMEHYKQTKGWRDKPFPLYERLEHIFGKDCGTGKTAYTLENLATDVDLDENSENDVEMLGNFSPMSVNQTDSTQRGLNQTSSQPLSRKRSRSGDPIIQSMDRFTNVLKETMNKTNETLDKFAQVLAKNKVNKNSLLATDLQKMQLPLSDQMHIMQKFMQKPEIAEVFKAQSNEEQKFQFIASILSGAFDG